jgi:hypothetical protein
MLRSDVMRYTLDARTLWLRVLGFARLHTEAQPVKAERNARRESVLSA